MPKYTCRRSDSDELLAQNETFMEKVFEYNEVVLTAAEVLRVLPEFMKGYVGPFIGKRNSVQDVVFHMIDDVVARRMEEQKTAKAQGTSWSTPVSFSSPLRISL